MGLFKRSSPEDEADADTPDEEQDEGEGETEETSTSDTDDADEADDPDDADAGEDDEEAAHEAGDDEPSAADDADDSDKGEDDREDDETSAPQRRKRPVALIGALGGRVVAVAKWRGMVPISIFLIFFLALFLRAYFYAPEACPNYLPDCQYLLSGNDPDYHKRAVDHLDATKSWLTWDWLQNYPQGGPNPNPPAFET
jgi:hypothetical protein